MIFRTNPSFFIAGLLASPLETASLKTTVSVSLEVFKLVDEISGALLSNRLTVLLVCVLDAAFAAESNMPLLTGFTVSFSVPSASPESSNVNSYCFALLLEEMVVGVEFFNVALPPAIDSSKSSVSRSPVFLVVPYTDTLNSTVIFELSLLSLVETINGALRSFNVILLTA